MFQQTSIFHFFGLITILLATIALLSYTTKIIIGETKIPIKIVNVFYAETNFTEICPFDFKNYSQYKLDIVETPCYNKTLYYQYIPWIEQAIWLMHDIEMEKQKIVEIVEVPEENVEEEENSTVTVVPTEEPLLVPYENFTNKKEKEMPSKVVYTILGALLILSSTFACFEVLKDKLQRTEEGDKNNAQDSRKCSLAEFTINRHLRKESQATLQKQTVGDKKSGNLNKQVSLDRACFNLNSTGIE